MGKKLAIEHHLIRPNEVIELLEMMGGKNKDNADGCSFLYYTLCTPKINNPNNEKVICGFTNLKMQNSHFAIFTLEKFWKKYPYKLNDFVLCNDGLLGVITKMEWDYEKSDMKYHVSFKTPYYNKWYSSKNINCKFMKAKKLAIKGHPTRGNEVIEILGMLCGKHPYTNNIGIAKCNIKTDCYYMCDYGFISWSYIGPDEIDDFKIFTLEEFLEKYPFKVGDKAVYEDDNDIVVISEIKWDDTVGDIFYNVKRIDEDDCFLCPPELLKPYKETNMNKKLAIKVHPTRNMEVIKLLEMMGGQGTIYVDVIRDDYVYFLSEKGKILEIPHCNIHLFDCVIFTLEEFLEKYPFKVGDKVFLYDNITEGCVTGMKWEENTVKYCVYTSAECWCDVKELLKWNAIDLVEKHCKEECEELLKDIRLKHLYELGMENIKKEIVTRMDIEDASFILKYMILPNKVNDELEYKFPDGYEFDKVENDKIILKPIKPKYPKTYNECCEVLVGRKPNPYEISFDKMELCLVDLDNTQNIDFQNPQLFQLNILFRLRMCRNAYWKIAGEEMELGKPWEPDFTNEKQISYGLFNELKYSIINPSQFVFPTVEMRDAFYDNFKDLIEQCKELL